jgi:tetraacyldisaccharide 4'-kinase
VGNLSMGGTGKTPLTLFLAEGLQDRGWSNVVISRGYGGQRTADPMEVNPGADPRASGDEAAMMAGRLGPRRVVVARKRIAGALQVQGWEQPPRCLLLDDGFQHRAIHRDVDLLVLDGIRTWGNGRMVPSGDLREPMESARRAHALVVTRASRCPRADVEAWWARHGSGGPVFFTDFKLGRLRPLGAGDSGAGPLPDLPPVLAFCAVGHPEAFFADLLLAGVRWTETVAFRDHHTLSHAELRELKARAEAAGAQALVCTEKDAIKLSAAHLEVLGMPVLVAGQEVESGGPLLSWVLERLQSLAPPDFHTPAD